MKTSTESAARVAFLNTDSNGQTFATDAANIRLDSFSGPRAFISNYYTALGFLIVAR